MEDWSGGVTGDREEFGRVRIAQKTNRCGGKRERVIKCRTYVQKPTVHRLRESLRSYALDDADEFVRPTTVYDEVLGEGLRALGDDESSIPDFAGITPAVEIDELRATLSHED